MFSFNHPYNGLLTAISLKNVRSIRMLAGDGKSAIRFGIQIEYFGGESESLCNLEYKQAETLFLDMMKELKKGVDN